MMTVWTDERRERLEALWAQGLSGGQIAGMLACGVTRNAVIGKAHRLGLVRQDQNNSARSTATKLQHKARRRRKATHHRAIVACVFDSAPLPQPVADDVARVSSAELEPHHCRFIPGDPRGSGPIYCGADAVPGLSYCDTHARRCFLPPAPRKREGTAARTIHKFPELV